MNSSPSQFSPVAVAWLEAACGSAAHLRTAHLLPGSTSATLYRLDFDGAVGPIQAVLRLFTNAEWLKEEPDIPEHEAAALQTAVALHLPAPQYLALDRSGLFDSTPALLMSCLPGRVELTPPNMEDWLLQQARFLANFHRQPAPAFAWRYRPYLAADHLTPPQATVHPQLWQKAIALVQAGAPLYTPCFIHRDFHPVNLLWEQNRLAGVVDWVNACLGPAGVDVAWNRQNLAAMYGPEVADRFLDLYCREMGAAWSYDPYWDLRCLTDWLDEPFSVYPPWLQFGLTHLSPALVTERLEAYLASILARC
jgi:Putative homoserine kinase type II (protein kinase fold)